MAAIKAKGKLKKDCQGGYYLLERRQKDEDKELLQEMRRMEGLRTEKTGPNIFEEEEKEAASKFEGSDPADLELRHDARFKMIKPKSQVFNMLEMSQLN